MIRHYLPIEATHWAVSVRAESTAPSNSDAHTQAYSDTPVTHNTYIKRSYNTPVIHNTHIYQNTEF